MGNVDHKAFIRYQVKVGMYLVCFGTLCKNVYTKGKLKTRLSSTNLTVARSTSFPQQRMYCITGTHIQYCGEGERSGESLVS